MRVYTNQHFEEFLLTLIVTINKLSSIEQLENTLNQSKNELQQKSYDSTGAISEHLLHKKIFDIISDKIEFTEKGLRKGASLKPGEEDIFIVSVSSIDLQKANTEIGKFAGDEYLKKTVDQNLKIFQSAALNATIYHRGAQNFTIIAEGANVNVKIRSLQKQTINIAEHELRISVAYIKLSDVATLYSNLAENNKELLQKKVFIELLLKLSEYEREFKVAFDLGEIYLTTSTQHKNENQADYLKYVAYIFQGTRFGNLDGFKYETVDEKKELIKEYLFACKKIAEKSVFEKEINKSGYLKLMLTEFARDTAEDHGSRIRITQNTLEIQPKQMFDAFVNDHQTPKHRELSEKKYAIETQKKLIENSASATQLDDLIKLKLAIEIEQIQIDIELCSIDLMTGLKNKGMFEQRLVKMHDNADGSVHVLALDLGFVKYFNKEGNRKIGDAVIKATGFILHSVENNFTEADVYRTGGDEFSILVDGDESKVIEIINYITELTKNIGPVPTDGKPLGAYIPESIQFNYGYCLKFSAKKALSTLCDRDRNFFSTEDLARLDETSERYDKVFYAKTLAIVQNMIANLEIDTQKMTSRCEHLRKVIRSGNMNHFKAIFPYSGKALRGVSPNEFETIVKEDPNCTNQEIVRKINELIGKNKDTPLTRMSIIERVVVEFVSEK